MPPKGYSRKALVLKRRYTWHNPPTIAPPPALHFLTPQSPLTHLVEAYVAAELPTASRNTRTKYRTIASEFEHHLGYEPRVSDLTDANVAGLMRATWDKPASVATCNVYRSKLIALWLFAHRGGILATYPRVGKMKGQPRKATGAAAIATPQPALSPPKRVPRIVRRRSAKHQAESAAPRDRHPPHREGGIGQFLHQRFIPECLAGRSTSTVRQYRNAISALCKWLCREPATDDLTEKTIGEFRESLIGRGVGGNSAKIWACAIRAIARYARPEAFPPRRPSRSAPRPDGASFDAAFLEDLDVDGSLWQFFQQCYSRHKLIGASDGTLQQHEVSIRRLCRFAGRSVLLSEATEELLCDHMAWMLDQGLERATVNSARGCIMANLRFAKKRKLISEVPETEKLRGDRKLPTAFTMPEFEKLLASAAQEVGKIGPHRACQWWPALLLVLYYSAIRLNAALSVPRRNVDLETGWLAVPAEVQKQRVEQRFRLPAQACDALRLIWEPERRELFAWPWRRDHIWTKYRKILERAGLLTPGKRFHKLRQTSASHIASVGGISAAARHLGHSNDDVVRRYCDPRFIADHDATHVIPQPRLPRLLTFDRTEQTKSA